MGQGVGWLGGTIPSWNCAGLSLPDWLGFIGRRRGQKIQVISFFMHGFSPHGNISKERRSGRGRERERTDETGKNTEEIGGEECSGGARGDYREGWRRRGNCS